MIPSTEIRSGTVDPSEKGVTGVLRLFLPNSVAVVGASEHPDSLGYAVLSNLLEGEFQGPVYPVSLKEKTVLGLRAYASLEDIEGSVGLVVIAIPAAGILPVLQSCVQCDMRDIVILSAGFQESGAEGKARDAELRDFARVNGLRVAGPNSLGLMNTDLGLNATFARRIARRGSIALVSQSGAIGVYALEFAAARGLGFSKFISLGNKSVINENHVLGALLEDPSTRVVLAYLEDFRAPAEFFALAEKLASGAVPRPLLLLKAGRGQSGTRAAASHTGALAQKSDFLADLCEQHGVHLMDSLEAAFDAAECLAAHDLPAGPRLGIVTNAGGPAILAADEAETGKDRELVLPELSPAVRRALAQGLPASAGTANPVDVLGDADAARYGHALDVLIDSGEVDSILVLCTPQRMTDLDAVAAAIGRRVLAARARRIPLVAAFARFETGENFERILADNGVPCHAFPETAVRAIAVAARHAAWRRTRVEGTFPMVPVASEGRSLPRFGKATGIIRSALLRGITFLDPDETRLALESGGFPLSASRRVRERSALATMAKGLCFPLAMKIVSPDIVHKSDAGGVLTGIRDKSELEAAWDRLTGNAARLMPTARLEGVLLQEMAGEGVEVFMGATRDPVFGPILAFGLGGTAVEALHDIKFARAPLRRADAEAMIHGIKAADLLGHFRNRPPRDLSALVNILLRLSRLMTEIPAIREVDFNPVFALERGAVLADARILLDPTLKGENP